MNMGDWVCVREYVSLLILLGPFSLFVLPITPSICFDGNGFRENRNIYTIFPVAAWWRQGKVMGFTR